MAIKNPLHFIGSVKTDHFLLTFKELFFIITYYRRINALDFNRKKKRKKNPIPSNFVGFWGACWTSQELFFNCSHLVAIVWNLNMWKLPFSVIYKGTIFLGIQALQWSFSSPQFLFCQVFRGTDVSALWEMRLGEIQGKAWTSAQGVSGWERMLGAVNPSELMVPLDSAAPWPSARLNKSKQIWKELSNWQELMKRDFSQERRTCLGSISGLQRQMRSCAVLSHSCLSILSWLDFHIF